MQRPLSIAQMLSGMVICPANVLQLPSLLQGVSFPHPSQARDATSNLFTQRRKVPSEPSAEAEPLISKAALDASALLCLPRPEAAFCPASTCGPHLPADVFVPPLFGARRQEDPLVLGNCPNTNQAILAPAKQKRRGEAALKSHRPAPGRAGLVGPPRAANSPPLHRWQPMEIQEGESGKANICRPRNLGVQKGETDFFL